MTIAEQHLSDAVGIALDELNMSGLGVFELRTLSGPTASVAEIVFDGHTYTGSAKLHPNDRPDIAIGEWLAISRALEQAAKHYKREAWRRVNAAR